MKARRPQEGGKAADKFSQMTLSPLAPLIFRLSLPAVAANIVGVVYNLTDTFYLGRLGTDAAAASGIVMPVMVLIQAFGLLFGAGAGNRISVLLGKKDLEKSEELASTAVLSAFALSCILGSLFLIFKSGLLRAMGATSALSPLASVYLVALLAVSPLYCTSYAFDPILRFQGLVKESMIGIALGAILNIFLEPVFIFSLRLGMLGAGIATAICEALSFFLLLFLYRKRSQIALDFRKFSFKSFGPILSSGMPNFVRNVMGAASTDVFNLVTDPFGPAAIAGVTIANRILLLTASAEIGMGRGYQPVCGYNYGARKYSRVRKGYYMILSASAALLILVAVLQEIFAPHLIAIFRNSPPVVKYGSDFLRFFSLTFPLYSFIICSNMMQQTLGHTLIASLVGLARQGVFLVPLLFILPARFGFLGLEICQPVSDCLTFLLTLPMQAMVFKDLKRAELLYVQNP
ncbi:MAG: MATE family efflux transporter [Aeriscardovia sp.]|nr:MATE family efflux transporter [Aeriscardovia sp.]